MLDVLIAGAGPVGLFLGFLLARQGHKIAVVDKKAGPTTQSRAFFVSSRTLDVLEHVGLVQHFLEKAYIVQGTRTYVPSGELFNLTIPDSVTDTLFPYITIIPQYETERIFVEAIETLDPQSNTTDAILHWNTELVSYTQSDDHVDATLTTTVNDSTKTLNVQARYIVGADGCHSAVRKGDPTWTFEGFSVATQFALADMEIDGEDLPKIIGRVSAFISSNGICGLLPMMITPEKNTFRLVASMGPYQRADPNERRITHGIDSDSDSLTIEKVQAIIDERSPLKLRAFNPIWMTYFHINERKANGYRRQRAFVIGDAAHCHSPVGGQGMNMGLQDAHNLAWKLSLVIRGRTPDVDMILDSFEVERNPIIVATMQATGKATEYALSGVSWIPSLLGRYIMSSVMSLGKLRENIIRNFLQLRVSAAPESQLLRASPQGMITSGHFVPETHVLRRRSPGKTRLIRHTLRQILHGSTRHTILWVATRHGSQPSNQLTPTFWESFSANASTDTVRPLVVESVWQVHEYSTKGHDPDDHWLEYNVVAQDSITRRVGLLPHLDQADPPAAVVIIRPDLYVAHSALIHTANDLTHIFDFLATYLS